LPGTTQQNGQSTNENRVDLRFCHNFNNNCNQHHTMLISDHNVAGSICMADILARSDAQQSPISLANTCSIPSEPLRFSGSSNFTGHPAKDNQQRQLLEQAKSVCFSSHVFVCWTTGWQRGKGELSLQLEQAQLLLFLQSQLPHLTVPGHLIASSQSNSSLLHACGLRRTIVCIWQLASLLHACHGH